MAKVDKTAISKISEKAKEIHSHLPQDAQSIIVILMIISIIIGILRLLNSCRHRILSNILKSARSPMSKRRISAIVSNHLGKTVYAKYGTILTDEIINACADLDPQYVQEIVDELYTE